MEKMKNVFVGGLANSGKNVLWRLLDGHTNIVSNAQHNSMGSFILSDRCKQFFLS